MTIWKYLTDEVLVVQKSTCAKTSDSVVRIVQICNWSYENLFKKLIYIAAVLIFNNFTGCFENINLLKLQWKSWIW